MALPCRVALLVNFIPPYRVPLFRELRSRVRELRVFVSTPVEPNRSWPADWADLDVVIQRNLTMRKRWRRPGGYEEHTYVHFPYDTLAQLWRFNPDVIISGELGLRSCLASAYRRLRPGVRLLIWATISERTEQRRGVARDILRPWLLRQADAVLVNGSSGARYIASQRVSTARVWRVPYTVDVGAFNATAHSLSPDVCRMLFVGLLIPRKGVLGFLTALARWAEAHQGRTIEFRIAGDGPERRALETLALPPNVTLRFLGNVSYERLPEVYRGSTMLVMPTLEDEWGVVINEAMAAGLPILGSRYSQAVEELVTDGDTGWTFTPDNAASVAAALDSALNASALDLERMRLAARARAGEVTPAAVAERIAEVIDRVGLHRSPVQSGA